MTGTSFIQEVHAESLAYYEDGVITSLTINPGESLYLAAFATVTVTGTIDNYGTITVDGLGTMVNKGTINNHDGGLIDVRGTLDNQPGAVINNNAGGIISSLGVIHNKGTIENTGSPYKLAIISVKFNFLQNSGTINNKLNGQIDNGAEIENLAGGTIINFDKGKINSNNKKIDNQGTIINHCGGYISLFTIVSGKQIEDQCKSPIAVEDHDILVSNGPILYDVTKNDQDYFGKGLKIISVTAPDKGGKAEIKDNSILYDPIDSFTGFTAKGPTSIEHFSYVIEDGNGQKSNNGDVFITVLNSRPFAFNDFARTIDFKPIVIHVLENDKDPNQDTLSIYSVAQTKDAVITTDGKTITYTPKPTLDEMGLFAGFEQFEYVVVDDEEVDGEEGYDTGIVSVEWITDTIANQGKNDPRFTSYAVDWVGGQRVDVLKEFEEFQGLVPTEKLELCKQNLEDKIKSCSANNENWTVDFTMRVEVDDENGNNINWKDIERWHYGPKMCYDRKQVGDTIPLNIYGEFIDQRKSTNTWDSENTTPKTGKTVGFYEILCDATCLGWACVGDSSKEAVTVGSLDTSTTPEPQPSTPTTTPSTTDTTPSTTETTSSVPPNRISESEHGHMIINDRKFDPTRIEETEVKLQGQIKDYKYGTVVMLEIEKPDGTIVEKGMGVKSDGTFDTKITLDETWEPGKYVIKTKYNDNQVGAFSIEIDMKRVPVWIKTNAKWWSDNQIDDNTFVQGIQFLIKENIMKISGQPSSQSGDGGEIPSWIKKNAGWWADGMISESDFVSGIKYLIENGIVKVP